MVSDPYRPDPGGGARIDQIAHAQGKKATYIRYDPGDRKKHAARVGLLNRLSVLVESESQLLNVAQCVEWDEFTDRRRMVEGFAKLPRQPFVAQFPLLSLIHI